MFTYKFIVRTEKNDSLRLRLTNNRKTVELSLELQMSPEVLADALSSNPKPENIKWRSVLSLYQSKLDEIKCNLIRDGRSDADVKTIKDMVRQDVLGRTADEGQTRVFEKGEFAAWFEIFTNTHPENATRTRKGYQHTLSRMRDYDPDLDKRNFADITVAYLDSLDLFWSTTMSVNSRNHHMRNIRAVFKYAIRNDLDIRNPFDRMKLKKEETQKRSLDVGELRDLFSREVEPHEEFYRDMFMLSFMLIGINPVDLYRLKDVSTDRIEYRRAKTHKLYSIKLEDEAKMIIEKYRGKSGLLSIADRWKSHESFAKGCNAALQSIGAQKPAPGRRRKKMGRFKDLTLYWARHSWATMAAELDIPDAVIGRALGHSSATPVTDIYIKRNAAKVDAANRRVLDWVLYGKR